ncbi:hypothetical protein ACFW4K_02655 [Nocardiopsis alba]|uniref:hypothetical protein n=1 Tax=Nocardiopsis alba TaxID=53437 RepID=UPI00366EB181
MVDLIVLPGLGISTLGVEIGMDFSVAESALEGFPGWKAPRIDERRNRGFSHYEPSELSVQLIESERGRVQAIEIYRPEADIRVLYKGIPVFEESAESTIRALSSSENPVVEDEGIRYVFPGLGIAFDRSVVPWEAFDGEGVHFESMIVSESGYFQ